MTIGLVGRKSGMTRVFTDDGVSIPVTVIEVEPNRVTRVKADDADGYRAIQVTAGARKTSRISKAEAGHFAKVGVEAGRGLWEFRLEDGEDAPEVGAELTVAAFEAGQKVDVTGQSKGKVRASRVALSVGISVPKTLLTVTRCRIARRVLSVSVKLRVVSSRARKWPVTWAQSA